jgi:hypothetical protein
MNKLKKLFIFLMKSIIVQAILEYLVEMEKGNDPLKLKPIFERSVCQVQQKKVSKL